jgi:hypothetical protein
MQNVTRWCFAITNYRAPAMLGIAGFEVSRDGAPEIQDFVHRNQRLSLKQMLRRLGAGGHSEAPRGSDPDNFISYCKRGNVFALRRPHSNPGPRGDVLGIRNSKLI